jgi:hypothetical protein
MPRHQSATDTGNGRADDATTGDAGTAGRPETGDRSDDLMINAATVGVICVGAALFEAALIPGMIIGVAAMLAPKALPRIGAAIEPAFRQTVRGVYKVGQKARHAVAEAQEQVRDVVAEADAEGVAAAPKA